LSLEWQTHLAFHRFLLNGRRSGQTRDHFEVQRLDRNFWEVQGAHDKISETKIEKLKILASDLFFKSISRIEICSRNRNIKLRYQTDFCSKPVMRNIETKK